MYKVKNCSWVPTSQQSILRMNKLSLQIGISGLLMMFRGMWGKNRPAKQQSLKNKVSAWGRHRRTGSSNSRYHLTGWLAARLSHSTVSRLGDKYTCKASPLHLQQLFLSHHCIGFYQITEDIIIQNQKHFMLAPSNLVEKSSYITGVRSTWPTQVCGN